MDDLTVSPASPSPPLLQQFLAGRDVRCPNCHYNVRDLNHAACPECGMALELRLGLVDRSLGWFVTGVIFASIGLGFFVISALAMIGICIYEGRFPPGEMLVAIIPELFLNGGLLALWIWLRSILATKRSKVRWLAAGLTGLTMLGLVAGMFVVIVGIA